MTDQKQILYRYKVNLYKTGLFSFKNNKVVIKDFAKWKIIRGNNDKKILKFSSY